MKARELTHTETERINALIPVATREADEKTKGFKGKFKPVIHRHKTGIEETEVTDQNTLRNVVYWSRYFHVAMDRMAKEEGLRC